MVDHFSELAARYSQFRPTYPAELFQFLATNTKHRELAWDCATGNGQAATGLAAHFKQVVATDISAAQIEEAIAHENIEYRVASAEASELKTSSVNLITVAEALHWFNIEAFFREVKRVATENAMLAVWSYNYCTADNAEIDTIYNRFYRETVYEFWPPERAIVETSYAEINFPIRRLETPQFEIRQSMTLEQFAGYLRSWSAVKRYFEAHGSDPVVKAEAELEALWGDQPRIIRWPLTVHFGEILR